MLDSLSVIVIQLRITAWLGRALLKFVRHNYDVGTARASQYGGMCTRVVCQ